MQVSAKQNIGDMLKKSLPIERKEMYTLQERHIFMKQDDVVN